MSADLQRVKTLLAETIVLLCKSGLQFKSEFTVEGLLGITIDKSDIFLINLKETIKVSSHLRQSENAVVDFSISPSPQKTIPSAGCMQVSEEDNFSAKSSKQLFNNSENDKYILNTITTTSDNSNKISSPLETNSLDTYNSNSHLENHGNLSNPLLVAEDPSCILDQGTSKSDDIDNKKDNINNKISDDENKDNCIGNNNLSKSIVVDSFHNLINKVEDDVTDDNENFHPSSNEYSKGNSTQNNNNNNNNVNNNIPSKESNKTSGCSNSTSLYNEYFEEKSYTFGNVSNNNNNNNNMSYNSNINNQYNDNNNNSDNNYIINNNNYNNNNDNNNNSYNINENNNNNYNNNDNNFNKNDDNYNNNDKKCINNNNNNSNNDRNYNSNINSYNNNISDSIQVNHSIDNDNNLKSNDNNDDGIDENDEDDDEDKKGVVLTNLAFDLDLPVNVKQETSDVEMTSSNNPEHINLQNHHINNSLNENDNPNHSFNIDNNNNTDNNIDLNDSFVNGALLDNDMLLDSTFPTISSQQNGLDFLNNSTLGFSHNDGLNKNTALFINNNNNSNTGKVNLKRRYRRNYHLSGLSASSSVQFRSPLNNPFHLYSNSDLKHPKLPSEQQVELLPGSGVLVSLSAYELFTGEQWSRGSKLVRRVVREVFPDEQILARSSCLGKRMGGCHVGLDHHKVHTIKAFVQQRMPQVSHTEIVAAINECCRDIRAKLRKSYYRNNKTAMLLPAMKPV